MNVYGLLAIGNFATAFALACVTLQAISLRKRIERLEQHTGDLYTRVFKESPKF